MGGLKRLEYRGYDSAGVAIVDDDGAIETAKRAGKLKVLADELAAHPLPFPRRTARGGAAADNPSTSRSRPRPGLPAAERRAISGATEHSVREVKDHLASAGIPVRR